MNLSNYSAEIQILISEIIKERYNDQTKVMKKCKSLEQYATEQQDNYLLGIVYFYLAEGYYVQDDYQNFNKYLIEGMKFQQHEKQWDLLARSYNLLGIKTDMEGSCVSALDYYLIGLNYTLEYDLPYERSLIYGNIGALYEGQKEYERARYYYIKCMEDLANQVGDPFEKENLMLILLSQGRCSLYLKDIEDAKKCKEQFENSKGEVIRKKGSYIPQLSFYAAYYGALGDISARDSYIEKIYKEIEAGRFFLDNHGELLDFCNLLLENEKYDMLQKVFEKITPVIGQAGIVSMERKLVRLEVLYYRSIGDREKYLEGCSKMFEMGELQQEELMTVRREATELRFSLAEAQQKEKEMQKEKENLRQKSETDELTGLSNRYKMNSHGEKLMKKSVKFGQRLGVCMLDIDYFKEYNDTYGHQKGDECIKKIGKLLKKEIKSVKNTFCARYGGDEFVIFYQNKSDEEIHRIAARLKKRVQDLKIQHDASEIDSVVSISQGIYNRVPSEEDSLEDYLRMADKALYRVKQSGRNGICIKNG